MATAGGGAAQSKVSLPAMALMINAIVFMALNIGFFIFAPAAMSGLLDFANKMQEEQAKKAGVNPPPVQQVDVGRPWVSTFLGLLGGGFIIFGAMKMRSLESWGLALAASIVSMVPYVSPCCCLGIPLGAWALVTLLNSEVKAAFRS
jgi:hypothetical protein